VYKAADMSLWQGRVDREDGAAARRWHQKVCAWPGATDLHGAATLLGFACDEGVRRNQGRAGARHGPSAIRAALAGLAYPRDEAVFDAGDVVCADAMLEPAQAELAERVAGVLHKRGFPLVLGGGHELAWGSFLGLRRFLDATKPQTRVGIVNFDAHFDLRNPQPQAHSGTAFRQIAQWCAEHDQAFHYTVFGINPSANTTALVEFASQHAVTWYTDLECNWPQLDRLCGAAQAFVTGVDVLYLTICLDVFSASAAPGVSAPAPLGLDPAWVIAFLRLLFDTCRRRGVAVAIADIAEMNPDYDRDAITAKLAARLVHEIVSERQHS
jgi:formiminoglutamase